MSSTFLGIEIGKRSLVAYQTGLNVIGHNLANTDNESYSRQKVNTVTEVPIYEPSMNRPERPGQIGQGVEVQDIRRARDIFLDSRLMQETGLQEYWDKSHEFLNQIEKIHNSLGDVNLREKLDIFWSRWQELSLDPSERAVRESLLESSESLVDSINSLFYRLDRGRREINEKVTGTVEEINNLSGAIRDLNVKILKSKTMGDNPNDLMDTRDALTEKLGKLVNITVNHKDNDETMIFIGERILVQGPVVNFLAARGNRENEGLADVRWESGDLLKLESGSLQAMLEARDVHYKREIEAMDSLAANLMARINELHKNGFNNYGKTGNDFFTYVSKGTDPLGNVDANGDNIAESTFIFQIKGINSLQAEDIIGENGNLTLADSGGGLVQIPYRSDEKISDLVARINVSSLNVNAYLDPEGRLAFTAKGTGQNPPMVIKHIEDSGRFLSGTAGMLNSSGAQGAFDYSRLNEYARLTGSELFTRTPHDHPASWIAINRVIKNDANQIAASDGIDYTGAGKDTAIGQGDGSIAMAIANLRTGDFPIENSAGIQDFYVNMITTTGVKASRAKLESEKYSALVQHLSDERRQVSGVNMDEEMTHMIAMQHAYAAGARVVSTMDRMLDIILKMA
ncbi:MAG: flagellar hook-associated protein FlgK [Spirochaetes bacterium GWF1_41_5]|nr:MAG: flagellar hook-associated protein FlgK [Spirochaetes bacterium GWF1_41_5]HBE02257.1 flagellar hook-associated protein FlgK [Spirochaetia bacterium]